MYRKLIWVVLFALCFGAFAEEEVELETQIDVPGLSFEETEAPEAEAEIIEIFAEGESEPQITSVTVAVGQTADLSVYAQASSEVCWTSDDKSIAKVGRTSGTLTGVKYGSTVVRCGDTQVSVTVRKAPTAIALNKSKYTMADNEAYTLEYAFPSSKQYSPVTFKSSDKSVATVDKTTGTVTAHKAGTAKITAKTFNGKSAVCTVTVKKHATAMQLSAETLTVGVGQTKSLTRTVTAPKNGYSHVTWSSENESVALVSGGKVTGVSEGDTVITCRTVEGDCAASCALKVVAAPAQIVMDVTMTLSVGMSVKPEVTVIDLNGDVTDAYTVSFKSSNTKYAQIASGAVKAVAARSKTTTITAWVDDYAEVATTCKLTTLAAPTKIRLSSSALMMLGSEMNLSYKVYPTGTPAKVTWTSSNSAVAKVGKSSGKITALKVGTATITAKTQNGKTDICKVTVRAVPESIALTVDRAVLGVGESVALKCAFSPSKAYARVGYAYDDSVISIENGTVTAIAVGTCTITAEAENGKTAVLDIEVKEAPTELTLDTDCLNLKKGTTAKLEVPSIGGCSYKSSDKSVCTVASDGTLTALKRGSAVITVTTYNGHSDKCYVKVYSAEHYELSGYIGQPYQGIVGDLEMKTVLKGSEYALGSAYYTVYVNVGENGTIQEIQLDQTTSYALFGISAGMTRAEVCTRLDAQGIAYEDDYTDEGEFIGISADVGAYRFDVTFESFEEVVEMLHLYDPEMYDFDW